MKWIVLLLAICSITVFAASEDEIETLNWNGVEVFYLEENQFPVYDLYLYFADGALGDSKAVSGRTEIMFDLLDSGTRRYNQAQISDHLDYYGVSHGAYVTHEYSLYSVSGLAKDIVPGLKKVCHLFDDANYPRRELKNYKRRVRSEFSNLVTNHSALADRVFRAVSLRGTAYGDPTSGTLKSLKGIGRKNLLNRLAEFKTKIKKKIFYTGPRSTLNDVKKIILEDCGFKWDDKQIVNKPKNHTSKKPYGKIYFVPIPKGNQAQIRMGTFLEKDDLANTELMALTSGFLGGGFTSKLVQEVRVKRGLTYTVGAFAGAQRDYGRSVISTFTKNNSVYEVLNVIKTELDKIKNGETKKHEVDSTIKYLSGNYLFGFEKKSAYLSNLLHINHRGEDFDRLYKFPEVIRKYKPEDLSRMVKNLFDWNKMTIVVVGNKKILKQLKKLGPVTTLNYRRYL